MSIRTIYDIGKHGVYGVSGSDNLQSAWRNIDLDNARFCS
jgi:hypothetical protein